MDACDVLIVGGGPAGSSCAWKLRDAGLEVAILDRHVFPRDKVCGGWITPSVLTELEIDPAEYAQGRVFQPITSFRTGAIGGPELETDYGTPVSYGIRRREFDDYLLKRSGARLLEGVALRSLERSSEEWIVNGQIRTRLVIGAGGHFCPVARFLGAKTGGETAVVAQEAEFEMDAEQLARCRVQADRPELYFCPDLRGYGWCFRKENVLNVGLGRMDPQHLSAHVADFLRFLRSVGRVAFDVPALRGHAYLLYGASTREIVGDGFLLIGDAAGLAYSQSGEGIRPAVESGLLAAKTIAAAEGRYGREHLEPYRRLLAGRFGGSGNDWMMGVGRRIPSGWIGAMGRRLLRSRWFVRGVVLDRWFLHSKDPALSF
jgi:geranylgeranyl reductase family protein